MDVVSYGGWRCLRIPCGEAEALVTLDVGPRVIRFGFVGGPNEFYENPKDMGKKGGDEYRSYGGHRLWIGPEHEVRTLQPENDPVEPSEEGDYVVFASAPDQFFLQKELRIKASAGENRLIVEHLIHNRGAYAVQLAPWALSVMAAGGECIFPQEPYEPHSENFLPVRPLVLWSYTDMSDERWTWGRRVVRLRQTGANEFQKVGGCIRQGYAAYCNHGNVFLKRFPYDPSACYPDLGCNFETFTRHDMLEVESLGAFRSIEPGEFAEHRESWYLIQNQTPPGEDEACGAWLEGLAADRPL